MREATEGSDPTKIIKKNVMKIIKKIIKIILDSVNKKAYI